MEQHTPRRSNHERYIHEDAPMPDQLHKLASIGAGFASAHDTLRKMRPRRQATGVSENMSSTPPEKTHYFIEEVDFLLSHEDSESEYPQEVRHRMAGRIGLRLVDGYRKEWSLNYFDTYWVQSDEARWLGSRALYRFKWNKDRAVLADRTVKLIGDNHVSIDESDLYDQLEHFSFRDDEVPIWHAQTEMQKVTSADCDDLIRSASDYFSIAGARR